MDARARAAAMGQDTERSGSARSSSWTSASGEHEENRAIAAKAELRFHSRPRVRSGLLALHLACLINTFVS